MTKTKLQIMREKKVLTVRELAEKMSENRQWLGNYMAKIEAIEQGASIHCFSDYGIKHLAQVLGCSVDELVEEE